ncbi:DHH family phosphoesterase [Desulfosporosinus nitroreducens]|uniref:Bifunctional oligoribonuclease/PAP phosphatase NrnA n=1 Tax=Desulfosporosinus nitroreducens TaxID=2018668 RepID=A0ABT8QTW2_9FIRM|nr:bifunctional oligoribonuclease/PAP phosphatase NrnA [Desulfosporosinus nitroreducens]MCO1601733.1 bifunctional oligoribonuclease/PAP phosphatase NrnA [Desulfosporosinus nitroreducens]MDO0824802.1 bifunctional oligoribonuclease/PAP phosphatase NrnA [Desulfosporosinus nitroreducens]
MNENTLVQEFIEVLRKAPKVALFSHVSPDGDCLGSMLAIGLALEKMGKEVSFYNPNPVPSNLMFLPGSSRISQQLPDPQPETLVFVDCTDLGRVNLLTSDISKVSTILNLDHHISNQHFGHINWVDAQASAVGELALTLINLLGAEIDSEIATNVYTAIVTDSGCFQYGNTTAQTHRLTAELLDLGIDLVSIHHKIFDQKPLSQIKLLQYALNGLEIHAEGQLALMTLSLEDFQKSGAEQELSEGLVNHARSIAGVEAAVLLKEAGPLEIKAGLRSNLWLDVNAIAAKFGGGGHNRAAGCTFRVPIEDAKQSIVSAIEEALRIGRNY